MVHVPHNKLVLAVAGQALLSTLMRSSRPPYLQHKAAPSFQHPPGLADMGCCSWPAGTVHVQG